MRYLKICLTASSICVLEFLHDRSAKVIRLSKCSPAFLAEMGVSGNTPIIVGVGDVSNRSKKVEDAIEPLELMLQAIRKALDDLQVSSSSAASLRSNIDSLDVVRSWTWPYPDLPGLIAERLDITPARQHCTDHGGNQPAYLLDEAARRISKGESKVAILTGGEALASCMFDLTPRLTIRRTDMYSDRLRGRKDAPATWMDEG